MTITDPLVIAGRTFTSRLVLGTSRYPNQQVLLDALTASGTEMVTVSIRRISVAREGESLLELLGPRYHLLPNTAGCYTARDAVVTAKLARGEGSLGRLLDSDSLYESLAGAASSTDSLLAGLRSGEGSIGQLIVDEALYEELLRMIVELNSILADLRANPDKYIPPIKVF